MKFTISFFLLFYTATLAAYPDSLKAIEKIALGISKVGVWESDSINVYNQQGFTIFEQNDDLTNWLLWHQRLGKAWRNYGSVQKALDCFNESINGMWRSTKDENEYKRLAWIYADIGYVYYRKLNELFTAKGYYEKASSIFTDTLELENYEVARYIYTTLGNIYSGLRDIENSRYYLEKTKSIYRNLQEWDRVVITCSNIALMHNSAQDYDQALSELEEGLDLIDSISLDIKLLLLTMAVKNFTDMEEYEEGRQYNDWAKKLMNINSAELTKNDFYNFEYEINYNYGLISMGENKFEESEIYYKRALSIHEKRKGGRRQFAVLHQKIGSLYQNWNKPEKAEEYYLKSLDYLMPVLSAVNNPDLILGKTLTAEPLLSYAFEGVAVACMNKYENSHNQQELEKAIQFFDLSNEVGLLLLQNYATEGSRLTALNKQRNLKEASLEAVYRLWQIEPNDVWLEKMFAISESSKAFLQLEIAQLSQSTEDWEEQQRLKYNILKNRLVSLEESIYELKTAGKRIGDLALDTLTKAYLETNEAIAKIRNEQIEKVRIATTKNHTEVFSIEKIQMELTADQVVIEYFLGEKNLIIFRITSEKFLSIKKELPVDFLETVDNLRTALTDFSKDTSVDYYSLFFSSASQLYDWLLKEALSGLSIEKQKLIIVPDGQLGFVPFEVLLSTIPEQGANHADLSYLIEDYAISYAPSASLLLRQKGRRFKKAAHLFAGFAPAYDPKKITPEDTSGQEIYAAVVRDGEFELPGATEEVETICDVLGGQKFMGIEASELAFKNKASNYQVLLLSMHSMIDVSNPNFTKLLFTKGASGEQEDDNLYAIELYNMRLNADLAVLSACNTGYGKLQPGEGVMSLSRAFFSAGVPSTAVSQWKVPDAQTKDIMKYFFINLKEGLSKDEALRQAKLKYLNNISSPQEANPFFWAGFIAAGNMEPIDLNVGSFALFWWIGGFLLLLLAFLLYKYYK